MFIHHEGVYMKCNARKTDTKTEQTQLKVRTLNVNLRVEPYETVTTLGI